MQASQRPRQPLQPQDLHRYQEATTASLWRPHLQVAAARRTAEAQHLLQPEAEQAVQVHTTITEAVRHTTEAARHRQQEVQATRADHHIAEVHRAGSPAEDTAEEVQVHHAAAVAVAREGSCNIITS